MALSRAVVLKSLWLLASLGVLVLAVTASLALGARTVQADEIIAGLTGSVGSIAEAAVDSRVPRTVLAVLVGAALAVSGATMQAVTRNPLADPGILGVSSGAALAVVSGIAFFGLSEPIGYIWVAIFGAAVAAVVVYVIGSLGRGGASPLRLALAGALISAALSSLVSAILLPRADVMTTFRFWQIGGVGGADWERISYVLPFLIVGTLACQLSARGMNMLALGDDIAAGLGEHVHRTRVSAAAGAVVLCGAATAIAGPIGFVGLVVPHACRLLIGTDLRFLIPFSTVTGAVLLVTADVMGRVVARPAEIEVGIITALIGAPFFIWIARRQKVREL